jgi:hypothetical protein
MKKVIAKAAVISSGNKLETNHDIPVPVLHGNKQSAVEIPLSQISSQHDLGSSRVIVHSSTLQNYVHQNQRSQSIDASKETEASKINLDGSTENPRPNYARVFLATQSKRHTDTSISTDESELFGAPRSETYIKGRYIVSKSPKKVQDSTRRNYSCS